MGYRNLLDSNLRRAFTLAKDLAEDVVLTSGNVTGFDFGTRSVTADAPTSLTIKALPIKFSRETSDEKTGRNTQNLELLLKSADAPNLTAYDTITVRGIDWKIGDTVKGDGHITYLKLFREG